MDHKSLICATTESVSSNWILHSYSKSGRTVESTLFFSSILYAGVAVLCDKITNCKHRQDFIIETFFEF